MRICRSVWLVACLSALTVPICAAQSARTGKDMTAGSRVRDAAGVATDNLAAKIAFRFDILNAVTNHQFAGQRNSFHVEYEYAGVLKGAEFDPTGHAVPVTTYPYFQSVRDQILDYIAKYPDQDDFYEVFGMNICRRVMQEFPQIQARP